MAAFFVITDEAVLGPFTGVELREAALASIIGPDAIIGGAPQGPWHLAADIGLFSEKKTPLPHPPEIHVPQYQVRGMPGAFQGPFKLRELIGFAARGMLPAEAQIQSDLSEHWVTVQRIRMLDSCLNGDLVMIDDGGKMVLRSAAVIKRANEPSPKEYARAPLELVQSVDVNDKTAVASDRPRGTGEQWAAPISVELEQDKPPSRLSLAWGRVRERIPTPAIKVSIPPRLAVQLGCLMLILAGVASAFSYWQTIGLQRNRVIGQWIARAGDSEDPAVGITLREDGHCVIFNTEGNSWTGNFVWTERHDDDEGFQQIAPFTTVFDVVGPGHRKGVIEPTDGYVRLQGFVKRSPEFDRHLVRELFLRREGDVLKVGYLTAVRWMEDAKRMEAGWLAMTPAIAARPDLISELRMMELELPAPRESYGGRRPAHLSDAIDVAFKGVPDPEGDGTLHESLAYSTSVDAAYLLTEFGVPDEARRLFPFEVSGMPLGPSFEDAQLVRYGELKFVLSSDGELRYVAIGNEKTDTLMAGSRFGRRRAR